MSIQRTRGLAVAAAPIVSAALVLAACSSSGGAAAPSGTVPTTTTVPAAATTGSPPAAPTARVTVVAATDVYGSLVKDVGGDRVDVISIINSPSLDPHEYETSAADTHNVAKAKLVVEAGADYDPFLQKAADAAATKPAVVNAVKLSGLANADRAGMEGVEFNEHLWYSLATMKKVTEAVGAALATADPGSAAAYMAGVATVSARIDALSAKADAVKAKVAGAKVAITEPVPLYLLTQMGFENATPEAFSEAVEAGTDPSAKDLKAELDLLRNKTVKLLAYNAQTETPLTKQVADAATKAGVPQVKVYETLPAGQTDYLVWIGSQIDEIATAVGG